MLQSSVFSMASRAVQSTLHRGKEGGSKEDSNSRSETLPTCRCPSCNEMTTIEGAKFLAPNDTHIESCKECGRYIEMQYDESGEWDIQIVSMENET